MTKGVFTTFETEIAAFQGGRAVLGEVLRTMEEGRVLIMRARDQMDRMLRDRETGDLEVGGILGMERLHIDLVKIEDGLRRIITVGRR